MTRPMNILALDVATKCGWALLLSGERTSGVWNLTPRGDESKGMRLIRLRAKLNELLTAAGKLDLVVYEACRTGGKTGQHRAIVVQSELQSVVKVWSHDHGIEYTDITPAEIKSFATGKGNANKELVMGAVARRWGVVATDDNEADAVALLELTRERYATPATTTRVQEESA